MPTLDAPAFATVLTPEAAIDLVQKEVRKKGWLKFDLGDIKLVYSPFWLFNYDVTPAGGAPQSGRAALNAFTGDLDDLLPLLMQKALKKTREAEPGAEIEVTAVREDEVKSVAQAKIAATAGAKREEVTISAASKIYAPFFRVFVDLADENYRIDVDAAMGAPLGLDDIPTREKTWSEATDETLAKMRTPQGFAQLFAQTISTIGKTLSGKGKGFDLHKRSTQLTVILAIAIIIIAVYALLPRGLSVTCAPDSDVLQKGLFGDRLTPRAVNNGEKLQVTGSCTFENLGTETANACAAITFTEDGNAPQGLALSVDNKASNYACSGPVSANGRTGIAWTATWNSKPGVQNYAFSYAKVL